MVDANDFLTELSLSEEETLAITKQVRERYLDDHDADSIPTTALFIMLDKSCEDRRANTSKSRRGFARPELLDLVRRHYEGTPTGLRETSLATVGQDVGKLLLNFTPKVQLRGQEHQVRLGGPTRTDRGGEGSPRYYLTFRLYPIGTAPLLPNYIGRCVCCGEETAFDPHDRCCKNPACPSRDFPMTERENYVTIVPERIRGIVQPPRLALESELFRFVPSEDFPAVEYSTGDDLPRLPFDNDALRDLGLSLGFPLLEEVPHFAAWSGFRNVFTLDMSTYRWTRTLKDPKSHAVINTALEAGVTHLLTFTAGNAGLALSRIAYEVNRLRRSRITVYSLVGNDVAEEIKTALRTWGSEIVPLPMVSENLPIVDIRAAWRYLHLHLGGTNSETPVPGAWFVTDGWDGVGIQMYRAIFARVFRALPFNYVVAPVGTGSLLLGIALAISDIECGNPSSPRPKLIGAMPYPTNIINNLVEQKMLSMAGENGSKHSQYAAIMPKLSGIYTPLAPCLARLYETRRVHFIQVSKQMQIEAAHCARLSPIRMAYEPSALAGFGALAGLYPFPGLREYARELESPSRLKTLASIPATVLVVNTGCGIFGAQDYEFLRMVDPT